MNSLLTNRVTTSAKLVLFTPGSLAPHEARDLWWAAYEYVGELIRKPFGIAPTVVVPEIGLKYRTRAVGGRLRMSINGEEVDSTNVPQAIAERVLPRLAAQGIAVALTSQPANAQPVAKPSAVLENAQMRLEFGTNGLSRAVRLPDGLEVNHGEAPMLQLEVADAPGKNIRTIGAETSWQISR